MSDPRAATHVDEMVGANIKKRRKMMGLTQVQLAEAMGITFQQLQKYEKAINRISAGRLALVAQCLGVNISVLYEGVDWEDVGSSDAPETNPEALAMAAVVSEIESKKTRVALLNLAKNIAA